MNKADIETIFEYNYWANKRILERAAKVSAAQLTAPASFPRGNLKATLIHILDAEYGWRLLLERGEETPDLTEKDFPTLESLLERWRYEEGHMRAYLARLSDDNLQEIVRYTNPQGIRRERVRWHGLYHVVNHGTQHRSEAAAMLTGYDQSPGDIDFSVFLIENAKKPA
jgi:uncharacterized damage-inducible protein DinB